MVDLSKQYPPDVADAIESTLKSSHRRRTRVLVRDENDDIKEEITEIISGEIKVDRFNTPHRLLTMDIYRPKTRMHPSDFWVTDTWQVLYEVWVDAAYDAGYDGWVPIPSFSGAMALGTPGGIEKSDIDSDIVKITCPSLDASYNRPRYVFLSEPKGKRNSDALAAVLDNYDELHGHARLTKSFSQSSARLATNFLYGDPDIGDNAPVSTWAAAQRLAAGIGGWVVFIDGEFRAVLKPISKAPVAKFSISEANIITPPNSEVRLDEMCNCFVVKGAKPEGKPQIRGVAYAASPYSPADLKRIYPDGETNSAIGTTEAAVVLAQQRIAERLNVEMSIDLDTLVDPRLEEYDYVQIEYAGESWTVPLTSFTIPLTGGSQQIASARRGRLENQYRARMKRLKKAANR